MPKPRGPTGSIRGIQQALAQDLLVRLVAELQMGAQDGIFERAMAARIVRSWGFDESIVDGFLLALERMPGVKNAGPGWLQLPPSPVQHALHRSWRFALGRADLADARALLEALQRSSGLLTPNLEKLEARLARAVPPLLKGEA